MTNTPDFRALAQELLAATQLYTGLNPAASEMSSVEKTEKLMDAMAATVAALATPPPLAPNYIDPEHHGEDRELLQVFYAACNAEGGTADEIHLRGIKAVMAAPAALATPPPEPPTVMEALAARPLLERVARMGDCIGANTVGEIMAISGRAAAWLEANPPGQPVAIEPRGCPTPGACSCVEPATPPPEPPTSQITFNAPSPPEEVIRLDKEGFHYKGQFVADAGEAHRLMMAFLEQNTKTKPEPPTDEELWAIWNNHDGPIPAILRAALKRWGHR